MILFNLVTSLIEFLIGILLAPFFIALQYVDAVSVIDTTIDFRKPYSVFGEGFACLFGGLDNNEFDVCHVSNGCGVCVRVCEREREKSGWL